MGEESSTSQPLRSRRAGIACERGMTRLRSTLDAVAEFLLHLHTPDEPVWRYFWPVLTLALREAQAAVALSGDFVMAPDEIMQIRNRNTA